MPTSGSVDYSISRDAIITESLQLCGVLEEGGSPSANQLADSARTLNLIMKSLATKGLQLWALKHGVIFPAYGQYQYKLGNASGADNTCLFSDYYKTEVKVAITAVATSIDIDSTSGFAASDNIGIECDDGTIVWRTVSGAPTDSDTLTLSSALGTGKTAAVDNHVYGYTSKIYRPLKIIQAWTRNDSDQDQEISLRSLQEYYALPNKTQVADMASLAAYDPQQDLGLFNIWLPPSNMKNVIHIRFQRPFEDFDAAGDLVDTNQETYLYVAVRLALFLSIKYGCDSTTHQKLLGMLALLEEEVIPYDTENASVFITPDFSQG